MQQVVGRNYHSSLRNNPEEHSPQSHISILSAHCFISSQPMTWLQKLLKYVTARLNVLISEESLQTVQQQTWVQLHYTLTTQKVSFIIWHINALLFSF
jgi:hypothetical protein